MARADVNQVTLADAIGISRGGLSERLNGIRPSTPTSSPRSPTTSASMCSA
jgi:DNA transposition AAA+ family ATPase